jgi:cob(I)alamin adenosyltransferase
VSAAAPPDGIIIVYTGNGKGKTTAALGLAWRALGRDLAVAVVQFIKGKWKTGERLFVDKMPQGKTPHDKMPQDILSQDNLPQGDLPQDKMPQLTFRVMGLGFTWDSDDLSRDAAAAQAAWREARAFIADGKHAVVILDELTYALNYGFVATAELLEALRSRPRQVSVVITGRNAPEELLAAADLVTEMRSLKHPFERGAKALPGIDY